MAQANVFFLVDINGIRQDESPNVQVESTSDPQNEQNQDNSTELLLFQQDHDPDSNIQEDWNWLTEFVLLTLFREANTGSTYDFSRVQWGFKFFDSSRHVDFRDGRSFVPFDYESFVNFEKQLNRHLKVAPSMDATAETNSLIDNPSIQYLSKMFKNIITTSGLSWPECQSQNMSRSFNGDEASPTIRNMVYTFLKVPRTEKELSEFAGLPANSSTKDFMSVLLPGPFANTFHHKLRIQMNFVDLWTAPANSKSTPDLSDWEYPKQIVRSLVYLGTGRIIAAPDTANLTRYSKEFGLIPYQSYLRSRLEAATIPNENLPSHIQRLAPDIAKKKISPDFDTNSMTRSLGKSGTPSVLEASFQNQSKVCRPFRPSSGFGCAEEDGHRDSFRHKVADPMSNDRIRDGERKRKRMEYEADNYYLRLDRRRMDQWEDLDFDSAEVDSQCERDRLASWVNNGVFNNKRKRQNMEPPAAVSKFRPPTHNNAPVFQEPAPKLLATRGKKMVATVERRKQRGSSSAVATTMIAESRRRSSEGVDTSKVAKVQEKALKAIKHRLKIHLGGELDHDDDRDPTAWLTMLKKEIKAFIDIQLKVENPCLVALAQALVNSIFNSCTQERVDQLRGFYRRRTVTAKELSEDILLVQFPDLNRNIIVAQAKDGHRDKAFSPRRRLMQTIAYRETELQIILRLEIAWCFAEPFEDTNAREDLLVEVVRLLQIISAYRLDPPIAHFMNNVLLPNYKQSASFMKCLYTKMNVALPRELAMDGSPVAGNSRREDDSSVISSTSSLNLYPEDSASQIHPHQPKRYRASPTVHRLAATSTGRKTNSGPKKLVKRQILVAATNPKLSTNQFVMDRTNSHSKINRASQKISPKRVRRNLFDVQKKDKKDTKILAALGTPPRLTKSPVFKSPKGKSPRSPSGFFRAARSRRQLIMSGLAVDPNFRSPTATATNADPDVLCPESPATPGGDFRSSVSRFTGASGSGERARVIQESPEVYKNELDTSTSMMKKVSSLSFYSNDSGASKSRAWEKSENKVLAARIKDSVDLRSKEALTLSDLDFLSQSPEKKTENVRPTSANDSNATIATNLSYLEDSFVEQQALPLPAIDKGQSLAELLGPAPDLDNPDIAALIASPFPLPTSKEPDGFLGVNQGEPGGSPVVSASPNPSTLQTPSKRVQFNLNENLVNTPSSARRAGLGTPKSILKETHEESKT